MLISPRPLRQCLHSRRIPTPSSAMVSVRPAALPRKSTETWRPRLYLIAFCSASCTIRNRQRASSSGIAAGTFSCVNVIAMFWLRQLAPQALQRRDQPDQPELRRMQPVRQIVHAARDVLRALQRVVRQAPAPCPARRRRSCSRSISSSAICWLMSSCRSRAMRARSVSCAFSSRAPRSRMRS